MREKIFKRERILFMAIAIAVFVSAHFCYAQGEIYSVKVEKNYLALRTAKAFDASNEIGQLYTGDLVEVQDKSDAQYWYVYAEKLGQSGYVNKDYLVPTNQQENQAKGKVKLSEIEAKKYQEVLANVESYTFGDESEAKKLYYYALAAMNPDTCPALLIAQKDEGGSVSVARVFQYDEENDVVYQPEEILPFGVAGAGGFRGSLAVEGDGNGLVSIIWSSGSGETTVDRVTLVENTLSHEQEWTGRIDQMPTRSDVEIIWLDLKGTESVDTLLALEAETAENETSAEAQTDRIDETLPQDGDRVVLQGTVRVMTYAEILALQGMSDPNPGYSNPNEIKTVFVLDSPQELTCRKGDGQGVRSGTATMLRITGLIDGDAYNGKHITASFDPNNMWWPSDASVPLGQPSGGNDVNILRE